MYYWEKLLQDVNALPANTWFNITKRADYEKVVETVKMFIDSGYQFVFSGDYKKIMRISENEKINIPVIHEMKKLPEGITVEKIERGHTETAIIKNQSIVLTHESDSYKIYSNGKLIAIES